MLKLVDRFPVIIKVGAAVLAITAASMVLSEPLLKPLWASPVLADAWLQTTARWSVYVLAVVGVLGAGWLRQRR